MFTIPNLDPYVIYIIKEITRWIGDNQVSIIILTNILTSLKIWSIRSGRSVDNKIITLLLSFISFDWIKKLTIRGQKDAR